MEAYETITKDLGEFVGETCTGVSQHSEAEWKESGQAYVKIEFGKRWIKFPIDDKPFEYEDQR